MSCWMPSNSQEAWFPQLRIKRLAQEAAVLATQKEEEEQRKARAKRKPAPAEPSSVEPALF